MEPKVSRVIPTSVAFRNMLMSFNISSRDMIHGELKFSIHILL